MDSWSFSYKKRTLKPKLLKRLEICIKLGQNNWIIISQTFGNQAKVMDCSSFSYFRYFHPPAKKKCLEIGSKEATKWPKSPNNQTFQPPNNRATEQLNCQTTELRITELRTPELPHRRTMYEPIHHTISQSSGCFCKTAGVRTLSDSVSSTSRWKVRLHCYSVLLVGV